MKVLVIGRAQNSDIIISDPYVSRSHAQLIIQDNGSVSIVDLNSKTGTLVNGVKISGEYQLSDNDIVKIGNSNFPWQKHLHQNADTFFDDDYEEEEEFEFENPNFFTKYKNLLIGLAAFILIAGGSSIYYFKYYKKAHKTEEVNKDKKEKVEPENEKEDVIVLLDDYQITLPDGFVEIEDTDDDVMVQYKDKKNKIEVFVYENDKSDFKKKIKTKKDKKLLTKYKDFTVKELKKQKVIESIKNENEKEINGIKTLILDMTLKNKKKNAKRAFYNGEDTFYEVYIVSKKSKKKEAKNEEIIDDIIASFKELADDADEADDTDEQKIEKKDDEKIIK